MIEKFRSKALKLAFDGDTSKITPNLVRRVLGVLDVLDRAMSLGDIEGLTGFHSLSGDRDGTFAVTITRNWRITFIPQTTEIENPDTEQMEVKFEIRAVDYEDYHGN